MPKKYQTQIGIFGGSGFYELLNKPKWITVKTKYGKPSDKIALGAIANKKVAFLPRHGQKHDFPPHKIPYKANLAAFQKLGIKQIIAPCAAGSLQPKIKPGHFVICDQFIDRTEKRPHTFYDGPKVCHIPMADPYCPHLRQITYKACQKQKIKAHKTGTIVIIQGPRFSTRAESKWFSKMGWHVINMTNYPEIVLARELQMCYLNISLITDYDAGLKNNPNAKPVTIQQVVKIFNQNNKKLKKLIYQIIKDLPQKQTCNCQKKLHFL